MRAILYARVSTEEQAKHGYSLTGQLEALRAHAASEGYEIIAEITDPGESGAYLERPGLDRVRDLVREGKADVVLAQDRDRFSREPAYLYLLQEEFAKYGAKLRALNARGDDTPEGQLTEGMLDQLAKYERAKLAERTRRGRLEKARRGGIKIGPTPKYGFKANRRRDGYLIDETTMPVVCRIIKAVAAGETLYGVTKMLDAEGVPTPNGSKHWTRTFVRGVVRDDAYFPHSYTELEELVAPEVAATLDPEGYYGIVWHNRTQTKIVEKVKVGPENYRYKRKSIERPRAEWIAIPVPAPPCVDRQSAQRARERISGNVRPASSGARVWELSGGLLYCGHCGRRMRGHNAQSKRGGKWVPIFYYVCPRKIHESFSACANRYHRAERLEELVAQSVSTLIADPSNLIERIDEKIAEEEGIARDPRREIATLSEKLEALAETRSRYLDLYADGVITKAELGQKLGNVDDERVSVEAAIASANDRQGHIEKWMAQKRTVLALYSAFASQLPTLFSPEARRTMYERLGLRVTAYKDQLPEIELTLDPNALPSVTEASETVEAAWKLAMGLEKIETIEDVSDCYVPDETTSCLRFSATYRE